MKNQNNTKEKKEVSKPLLVTDKPIENEVEIKLSILDLRYGNANIESPQITTLYNGKKIQIPIPFTSDLTYHFETVEDKMVLKYAITSHEDLLGFLYLEIPQKFKYNTNFTIDDWFPVKQVEIEQNN